MALVLAVALPERSMVLCVSMVEGLTRWLPPRAVVHHANKLEAASNEPHDKLCRAVFQIIVFLQSLLLGGICVHRQEHQSTAWDLSTARDH